MVRREAKGAGRRVLLVVAVGPQVLDVVQNIERRDEQERAGEEDGERSGHPGRKVATFAISFPKRSVPAVHPFDCTP